MAMTLPVTPSWIKWLFVLASPVTSFLPAICLHFALVFPEPSRLLKRFPRMALWIYAPIVLISLPLRFYNHFLMTVDSDRGYNFSQSRPIGWLEALLVIYVLASMAVLAMKYRHSNQTARRKLRVLVAGWIVGALPIMTITLLVLFEAPISAATYVWVGLFGSLALLL